MELRVVGPLPNVVSKYTKILYLLVIYSLELCNAMTISYTYHLLSIKVELVVWTFIENQRLYLVKIYINCKQVVE